MQGDLLKVMGKKELVKIDIFDGEEPNSKVFVLTMDVSGLGIYEKAKATTKFINKETQVLEQVIDGHLRQVFREKGVAIEDGSNSALQKAFYILESQGVCIGVYDRYYEINNERIIGESPNGMTVIEEDGKLSCAMEVVF